MIWREKPTTCEHCGKVIGYGDEVYHANGMDYCSYDCWSEEAQPSMGDVVDWVMNDTELKDMFFDWFTEKERA